jgi:predicted RNase H-like HicB family nuclease
MLDATAALTPPEEFLMQYRYTVVIEYGPRNYSAFAPDVLGRVTTGATVEETRANMAEALTFHLAGMVEDGDAPPPAATRPSDVTDLAPGDVVAEVVIDVPGPVAAPA